jgi:hypothetical protein
MDGRLRELVGRSQVSRRWLLVALRRSIYAIGILAVLCAIPIVGVETSCTAVPKPAPRDLTRQFDITDPGYRRAEGDSYLTYPEWYIVHAYADLAAVTRQSSESGFDYIASIRGFWTSLCSSTIAASGTGPVTFEQKVTNYIIGISFTGEMAVKGLYERTIGAFTAWVRGPQRTPEDAFALRLLDDYAAFLEQTPWYRYPFGSELVRFWRDTSWSGGNPIRKIERRFGLSLEYGIKAGYALLIGYIAGYSPAELRIESVIAGLDDTDIAADPRISKVRDLGNGATLIETARYQEFTEVVRGLGARGRTVIEIAGNRRILTTVLARNSARLETAGAAEIFSLPIQSRPGWQRVGLDTEVRALAQQIGSVERQGAVFEHAYDY